MKILLIFFLILSSVFFPAQSAGEISYGELNSSNVLEFLQNNPDMKAETVNINIQNGKENLINTVSSKGSFLYIMQEGNFNTVNYNGTVNRAANFEIRSTGFNNYIDVTGSNSVSDGMKINIKGNDKMVFIRNY